jgi:hypothetical protein
MTGGTSMVPRRAFARRRLDFFCVAGKSGRRRSRKLHHLVVRLAAVDFAGLAEMQPNCAFRWREFRLIY